MKLPRLYGGRGTRLRLARTANSHNYNLLASNQVRVSRPEQGSKERKEEETSQQAPAAAPVLAARLAPIPSLRWPSARPGRAVQPVQAEKVTKNPTTVSIVSHMPRPGNSTRLSLPRPASIQAEAD